MAVRRRVSRVPGVCFAAVLLALVVVPACGGDSGGGGGGGFGLGRHFEYEEEIYLALDGTATLIVNTSIPALVDLHGFVADIDPTARVDREAIRAFYTSEVTRVTRVSQPWRRRGRRFVQVRLETSDIRRLGEVRPFAWASTTLGEDEGQAVFRHRIEGPSRGEVGEVGWDGSELVAIRMHLPAKIRYHNAPSGNVERGNILTFEQTFAERRAGTPLEIEVRMERQTILYTTLIIFGVAVGLALALLGAIVVWVKRKGRAA